MPEVYGSNLVITNFYIGHLFDYCQLYWKDENKEKEAGIAHLEKHLWWTIQVMGSNLNTGYRIDIF